MAVLIPPIVFGFAAGLALTSLWHDLKAALPSYRALVRQREA